VAWPLRGGRAGAASTRPRPSTQKGGAVNEVFPEKDRYSHLVEEAGRLLDEQLTRIRKDCDEGTITIREAADERIRVMTEHLDKLRELRDEFLS
jgi:hypothetical protein